MFKINKTYQLEFLDHEMDNDSTLANAFTYKEIKVKLIGKVLAEFDDYIVVSTWDCPENITIYRIIKSCIIKHKQIKV